MTTFRVLSREYQRRLPHRTAYNHVRPDRSSRHRSPAQPLHRVSPLDGDHDDAPVDRLRGPVHHQEIAVQDAGVLHQIAIDPHRERRGFVLGQVERRFEVVLCRARKARGHLSLEVRQHHRPACGPLHQLQTYTRSCSEQVEQEWRRKANTGMQLAWASA